MDKKDIINKIVETIKSSFEEIGFSLKSSNKFEKKMVTVCMFMKLALQSL